jgi:hypothetical protein
MWQVFGIKSRHNVHIEIESRLDSENIFNLFWRIFSSRLPFKIAKFEIRITINLCIFLQGCKTCSFTLRDEQWLREPEGGVWRSTLKLTSSSGFFLKKNVINLKFVGNNKQNIPEVLSLREFPKFSNFNSLCGITRRHIHHYRRLQHHHHHVSVTLTAKMTLTGTINKKKNSNNIKKNCHRTIENLASTALI